MAGLPPLLVLLFLASGASALVYEVVWFQLLALVIGASSVSLGILLGTYMGGLCVGSLLLPRLLPARLHGLKVYAALEFGIGLLGVAVLFAVPEASRIYAARAGPGLPGLLLRGGVAAACLLPPTILMGATLPAIARWVRGSREGAARLGLLYAANLAGAVVGCLGAAFYLLRLHDLRTATFAAAGLNLFAAAGAMFLARTRPEAPAAPEATAGEDAAVPGRRRAFVVVALSGFTALGAEVVWTRLLSLLMGATVYAFSIILAVFLAGLGIGSAAGAALARRVRDPVRALGGCQLLLAGGIAWAAWALSRSLPYWPVDPSLATSAWLNFQLDLMRCVWALLPATMLWGAAFPLAVAAVAEPGKDAGRRVGGLYAANTVGAIFGALAAGVLAIAWIGTRGAQQAMIALSGLAAAVALFPGPGRRAAIRAIVTLLVLAPACALAWFIPGPPPALVAFGRYVATWWDLPGFLYVGEGRSASIAVSENSDGTRYFHVSGKAVATTDTLDMRLQLMLGHLPGLMHPGPRSVLVVGCGAGVTAGSLAMHPSVEKIVLCEIEPLIPPAAAEYFEGENEGVVTDPRTRVVVDDARHFVLTTKEKFDIVTSDPIHPWVRGAATLYTREYFERCREILNPGGIVTQWVPLYETTEEAVRSELATFFDVFPEGTIWANEKEGGGYDTVLLGRPGGGPIDLLALQARLNRPDHARVQKTLSAVNLGSAFELLSTYAARARDLAPWLEGAPLNLDRDLRLQYLAGMAANLYREKDIYESILAFRRFPENLILAGGLPGLLLRYRIEARK